MPFNLLKQYNELLEIDHFDERQREASLRGVFNRDIKDNDAFAFRGTQIYPIKQEGKDPIEQLFWHLITAVADKATKSRAFEADRSKRLHWIRYHVDENQPEKILVFSVEGENRTYILDKDERYVVIFEPQRRPGYYLLTAYYLKPARFRKLMKKYEKRKLPDIL